MKPPLIKPSENNRPRVEIETCLPFIGEIMHQFDEGVILLNAELEVILVNTALLKDYPALKTDQFSLSDLELISQKSSQTHFNLHAWLSEWLRSAPLDSKTTLPLWLKKPHASTTLPIEICPSLIQQNDSPLILLKIVDLTLKMKSDAQAQLMRANHAGQFITDQHGRIAQPNQAFCAYSGLSESTVVKMNYLEWIQAHVSFKIPQKQVIKYLLDDHFWSGEVKVFSSSEHSFDAILSLSMMLDSQNNIQHFVGTLQDLTDIKQAHHDIHKLAQFDKLTGLANRAHLHQQIQNQLNNNHSTFNTLYFIDLDGFKIINDTFGDLTGDQLITQVAKKLESLVAEEDTLARVSGDEFVILQPLSTEAIDMAKIESLKLANKIVETIDGRYDVSGVSLHSSASVGVCIFPLPDNDSRSYRTDELTSFADMAMYEAKKLGGNQVYLFEHCLIKQAKQRLELIEALNHSELDEEFQIFFQAQVDRNGALVSAETLIRWFHPALGIISPAKFIPVAEEGRQIIKIGLWVIHKAFLQAKAWNKIRPIQIAINISPIQFHEQSFVEMIIGLVKFTQVDPHNITLELTEGVLIRNAALARQKIQHLVSLGFKVSIDDFGTGYSSLSYLQKLPIHELKIDQDFIKHIPGHPDDEAIVESIINLAKTKKLAIVAEGVENQTQADYLIQKHPDILIQGFHYSKPIPAVDFEATYLQ